MLELLEELSCDSGDKLGMASAAYNGLTRNMVLETENIAREVIADQTLQPLFAHSISVVRKYLSVLRCVLITYSHVYMP